MAANWASYGVANGYEALVNAIVADVLVVLKSKRMPSFEFLLKHGLEKAIINIVGSLVAHYVPMTNINGLDFEYIVTSIVAGTLASMMRRSGFVTAAEDQALISVISHAISSKTVSYPTGWLDSALGTKDPLQVNTGSPVNY